MSLDFHTSRNGGPLLYQVDDRLFNILRPAFRLMKQRTGISITPFDDTQLTPENSTLLAQLIRTQHLPANEVKDFLSLLDKVTSENTVLWALGD